MHAVTFILTVGLVLVAGAPKSNRIVGGSETTIGNYPFAVALLFSPTGGGTFRQQCGGAIINNRSVLSAASCFLSNDPNELWRSRVGSTNAASGGVVHNTAQIIRHPNYKGVTQDSDIAIIRVTSVFSFNNNVQAGKVASPSYNLPDNQAVWGIGWGATQYLGMTVNILRHVQMWTINRGTCNNRYFGKQTINDNMLCAGWLDVGGRDFCHGDSGSPLLHNNNIVGVSSFSYQCGVPNYPGVSTFVPRFTHWIVSNA